MNPDMASSKAYYLAMSRQDYPPPGPVGAISGPSGP